MGRSRVLETVLFHRWLILTLVVALILRLGLALAVQHKVDQPPAQLCLIPGDAEGYWELARAMVCGHDYAIYDPPRHVLRMPGFPLLLAISQFLFGFNPFAARCLLAGIGTAACGVTYWLGVELANRTTGLLAALYTALSPTLALFSVLILGETTFALAELLSLVAIARLIRQQSDESDSVSPGNPGKSRLFTRALVAGLLVGVATLVRPTWLYAGVAISLGAIASRNPFGAGKKVLVSGAGLLIGVGLAMAPWTIRNFRVTGHLVPTTLWVGASLYDGLNASANGDSNMQFFEDDQLLRRMSEYEMDQEYRRRAWQFARQHPRQALWLALQKQQRYWSLLPNAEQFRDRRINLVVVGAALPLLVFGIAGLWLMRRDAVFVLLTAGPVILFAAMHLLFVGSIRYRLPAEYPLAVLAGVGLRQLLIAGRWWPQGLTNLDRGPNCVPL